MQETKRLDITYYPWDFNGYKPVTYAEIIRDDGGFGIHFVSYETELTALRTEHNKDIFCDSTVEAFLNFSPDTSEDYMNFEVNSIGAMHCAKGGGRHNRVLTDPKIIDTLNIKTEKFSDRWEAEWYVSIEFIKEFYPDYRHGGRVTGNFYKTGEEAKYPHWGSWRETGTEKPDFHRPESFGIVFE